MTSDAEFGLSGARIAIDGPFTQTRQLDAGFWIWEVEEMAEAVAWAKRCPNPMPGPSELEISRFSKGRTSPIS